jgi:2-oxoglutarate dehydrogenase E2 component (dihydrolipoamide succinyltransferase)
VEAAINAPEDSSAETVKERAVSRNIDRNRMTALRRKLSQRLVAVKNETAMLTTFNEIDMSNMMDLRKKYQQQFVEKHGLKWVSCLFLPKLWHWQLISSYG